jgi:hypothetical protein
LFNKKILLISICIGALFSSSIFANPALTAGIWKDITPPAVPTGTNETCIGQGVAIDPTEPNTIYWCTTPYNSSYGGLFKSTNGGGTWRRDGAITPAWQGASDYLDEPLHVRINPNDHTHMYVNDGVRGSSQGFFISHDGGEHFTISQGFRDCLSREGIDNQDLYDVAVDPDDFNHVLISFHYRWGWTETKWNTSSGVLESKDGGLTWNVSGFVQSWGTGLAVKFLYDPAKGIGNSKTWLLGTQGNGFWRTTDAGANWTQVSTINIMHGGAAIYYASNGTLYTSSEAGVLRSTNNGASWTSAGYTQPATCVYGDGTTLYTAPGWNGNCSFKLMPENSTGTTWTDHNNQSVTNGPYEMAFDRTNKIMYSSNWCSGIWALKLPSTATAPESKSNVSGTTHNVKNPVVCISSHGLILPKTRSGAIIKCNFDINGRQILKGGVRYVDKK